MSALLSGQTALILGVANKWSLAYAIAQAYAREGARLILTYQGERQKTTVEELGTEISPETLVLPCDVTDSVQLAGLVETIREKYGRIDTVVHSIAFANREDLSRAFVETSRDGYLLAQEVSAYSLIAVARALAPLMTAGGSIITLSYLGAVRVVQNYNVMGVAKAALEASVRYLASDLGAPKYPGERDFRRPGKDSLRQRHQGFFEGTGRRRRHCPTSPQYRSSGSSRYSGFFEQHSGRGVTGNVIYVDAGFQIMALAVGG